MAEDGFPRFMADQATGGDRLAVVIAERDSWKARSESERMLLDARVADLMAMQAERDALAELVERLREVMRERDRLTRETYEPRDRIDRHAIAQVQDALRADDEARGA